MRIAVTGKRIECAEREETSKAHIGSPMTAKGSASRSHTARLLLAAREWLTLRPVGFRAGQAFSSLGNLELDRVTAGLFEAGAPSHGYEGMTGKLPKARLVGIVRARHEGDDPRHYNGPPERPPEA